MSTFVSGPRMARWFGMAALFAASNLLNAAPAQAATAGPAIATGYTQTQYPVVLVHGFLGFDNIGPINYWYGIPAALREGGAVVYVTQQSAANSSELRGEQLLKQLLELKRVHGHAKFNLIGHSHGGQTVRYVASVMPALVASVTTVGAPHQGTPVADAVERLSTTVGPGLTKVGAGIVNGLSRLLGAGTGLPQDSLAALRSLSTAGAQAFNRAHPEGAPTEDCGSGPPQVGQVAYFSMGGTAVKTNLFDLSDALLGLTGKAFKEEANDGLVGRCSSHWGVVLRDNHDWNHLDEVNQVFGLRAKLAADPKAVYRAHVNRLKGMAL